jgi:hypothetical protein
MMTVVRVQLSSFLCCFIPSLIRCLLTVQCDILPNSVTKITYDGLRA